MKRPLEPGEHRIRLTLQYDGAGFAGWQVQPGKRTVQGEVETALERLTLATVHVVGAGRTDSGVHAAGQVAGVVVPVKWTAERLERALNAVLPSDLRVARAAAAPAAFHPRYDARARGYVYRLGTRELAHSPFHSRWCWALEGPVDEAALHESAGRFVGEHSFRAFAKVGQPQRGERCRVHRSRWLPSPIGLSYEVVANRFLHHMVRYMVGTMIDVALGRRPQQDVSALLDGASAQVTSGPAPAEGLFLSRVYYDSDDLEDETPLDEIFPR